MSKESKTVAEFLLLGINKTATKMMQTFNVFEEGKVAIHSSTMVVEYMEGEKVDLERASKVIETLSKNKKFTEEVILIHLYKITNDNVTIHNDGSVFPYVAKDIRIVSTGKKWFMFSDYIKGLGFEPEMDKDMYIKGIKK